MSRLMNELIAEAQRVNELQVEVDRSVAIKTASIKADRDAKGEAIGKWIVEFGWKLIHMNVTDRIYDVPLGMEYLGRELVLSFSKNDENSLSIIGGWKGCIEFRVSRKGLRPDYPSMQDFADYVVDHWTDETKDIIEDWCAKYIKELLVKKMEAMQKKLENSNNEFARYFRKEN